MEQVKRQLKRAFWFLLALVFLFESWLWDNVKEWLRALGRMLGVERLEPWLTGVVARLSPRMTLVLFATPAIAVYPFKFLALALIAHGHVVIGLFAVFLAKTLALGVTSFLFDICRDKLLQMQWFGRFYSLVLDARAWATALVAPYKARVKAIAAEARTRIAAILGEDAGEFKRRLARMRERIRSKRSA